MSWTVWLIFVAAVLPTAVRRWNAGRGAARPAGARRFGRKSTVMLLVAGILGVQTVLGVPAFADQCGDAPIPEQPGGGMVGAIDPPAIRPQNLNTNYGLYGYAGTVWHVYEQDCVLSKTITDPNAVIDTWAGNELLNVGKNIVGATNSLQYAMLSQDSMFKALDNAVEKAAQTFYNSIYVRWFGPVALLLALLLFRYVWTGDLANVGKRGMWALAGMWLAASVLALGPLYSEVDSLLLQKTSEIQAGFIPENQVDSQVNALPDQLYDNVVFRNWERGEVGSAGSAQDQQWAQEILQDQAWANTDLNSVGDSAKLAAKQNDFKSMPGKLGPAAGYFEGTQGSRTGDGFLGLFQGVAFALFQLFAKAAVLLAQVLLRILMLAAPLIGLAAMLMPELLPRVGKATGAVLFNVLLLSAMAGMDVLLLNLIFTAGDKGQLSLLAQILLATLITVVFFMIGKPMRRMWQMVELSVGAAGLGAPASSGLLSRLRRKKGKEPTPQEEFWENVRTADGSEAEVNRDDQRRRVRPEARYPETGTVTATAQRMDRRFGRDGRELPGTPGTSPAYALPGGPRGYTGPSVAVPEAGSSRVVDTPPVVDAAWDRGEDALVVPSRVSRERQSLPSPRKAEMEMVAGRPVFVLYRPSRGLEVRDADWDQTGRTTTR